MKNFTPALLKKLKQRWKLILVLVAVLFKGLAWAIITPPWQTPDEPSHYAHVQYLAVEGRMPLAGDEADSEEEHASLLWSEINRIAFHAEQQSLFSKDYAIAYNQLVQKKLNTDSSGVMPSGGYPPLYYILNILPYYLGGQSILYKLFAMRVLSVILELLLVYFIYLSGNLIRNESLGLAAATMVGFHPELSMIFSSVNNDVLVDLMGGILFYELLRFQNVEPSWKTASIAAITMGMALLSKAEAWPLVGVFWICLFIGWLKTYKDWTYASLALAVGVLIYSPWAIFSWIHYHSLIGSDDMNAFCGPFFPNFFQFAKQEIRRWHTLWVVQFFADFGWLDTVVSKIWYLVLSIMEVVIGIGTASILLAYHMGQKTLRPIVEPIYKSLSFIVPMLAFLYYIDWVSIRQYHQFILQGRHLLPVIGPITILILLVFDGITGQRYSKQIFSSFAIFMVVFNVASLLTIIFRYYGVTI
jgi:hypothetical protein